jgi:DNA polymerase I-like protein with 3'-5' exonuclease and polymerase domains/uracil-DNA glycosylase
METKVIVEVLLMKILFLQEFIRENHMKRAEDGTFKNIFFQTKGGQILKKLIEDGLNLKRNEYYIDYAYSLVPKVLQRNKFKVATKYKPPSAKEAAPEYQYLFQRIVREKPDIIIPSGNIGCKALTGKAAISSQRGVPVKVTVKSDEGSHDVWVLPMYSMEYMLVNPSVQNLIEADFVTLKKFVDQGEAAFIAKPVDYEDVTTIERVREVFTKDVKEAPIVAWDLETNTLHPELPGAKPLVISLSFKEGTGLTIPLEHKEFQWLPGHLAEIYKYIAEFVADPNIIKVGHNIKFDIRFLRLTRNINVFNNNRDTKVMYYLLINQEVEGSLQLSDMAYELTDMGGYDKPLDDFKKQYVSNYVAKLKQDIEQMKADYKAQVTQLKEEYKEKVAQEKELARAEGRKSQHTSIPKPDIPPKPEFPTVEPPKNEVDGGDFNYEWIPLFSFLSPYASGDVDACLRIHNKLDAIGLKPENARLRELYTGHYADLTNVLAKIEANGVKMDVKYNDILVEAYTEEEERILQEMRKFPEVQQLEAEHLALYQRGVEEMAIPKAMRDGEVAKLRDKYKKKLIFNPNSSDDKKKVLFEYTGIKLPYNKEYLVDSATEDGIPEDEIEWYHYKTDTKAVLPYLVKNHPEVKELAELLLTHSLVKTRKQNFTYKLRAMVDPEGKLHGGFNPTGTATSRLSSSDPNLQQMPRKTGDVTRFDYKYPIKRMFVTSFPGGALLQLDYSSLESRVLALAANDEEMTQAFLDGKDVHRETASLVFGVPEEKVTDDQRSDAKSTTFGIAYGETPFSYYAKHGMTLEQAEKLFEDFFRNKPRIKQFIDDTHEIVKKYGYVECLHGFRRNLRDIYSQDNSKRNGALRQSVNTRIQGSGAFLTNSSVVYINKFIEKNKLRSKIILTVHDSIVMDCPPEEVHIMARAAKYIMENLPIDWLFIDWKGEKLRYPIAADVEIGVTYNDMVNYDMEDLNTFQTIENYCKYHLDLKKVKDYKNTKLITEDRYEEMKAMIEANKPQYQMAV